MDKKEEFVLTIKNSLLGMDKDLKEIEFSSISLARIYLKLVKAHIPYAKLDIEKGKELVDLLKSLKFEHLRFKELVNESYHFWNKSRIENELDLIIENDKETMMKIMTLILNQYENLKNEYERDDFIEEDEEEVKELLEIHKDEEQL